MQELQLTPAGSKTNVRGWLLAAVVLAIAAFAVFYFNPHRVADFKVLDTVPFAPRTTFEAMDGGSAPGSGTHVVGAANQQSEDDLYVVATASLKNDLRLPIFITGGSAQVTFGDGSRMEANMLSATDLKRLEGLFPALLSKVHDAVQDGDQVDPGATRTGSVVFAFPGLNAAAWSGKRGGTLTLSLRNQGPQTATIP